MCVCVCVYVCVCVNLQTPLHEVDVSQGHFSKGV